MIGIISITPATIPIDNDGKIVFILAEYFMYASRFWGNFGVFEDSLPDGYGRYLLNRLLKKQGLPNQNYIKS